MLNRKLQLNSDDIVWGLVNRDKNAIGEFWYTYYDKIYPICAYILGERPDAHDMTVEILLDFIENRAKTIASSKAVYSFLRQTAVRRSIRYKNRQEKSTQIETENHEDKGIDPESAAELNRLKPLLHRCMKKLTPKTQASLWLKFSRKISNEQIGEIVGGSKSYIGRLLKQGQKQLKQCVLNQLQSSATGNHPSMSFNPIDSSAVSSDTVRSLLDNGHVRLQDDCGFHLDATDDISLKRSESHLLSCSLCRRMLLYLHDFDLQTQTLLAEEEPVRMSRPPGAGNWKWIATAAGLLVMLGSIFLFRTTPEESVPSSEALSPKGHYGKHADQFFMAIERGQTRFTARPLDELMTNDRLGFFYTADAPGYLTIVSLDDNAVATLLYPVNETSSAPIAAGEQIPIVDGAVVGDGVGCEWIVAVFSDKPLISQDVKDAIFNSAVQHTDSECGLLLDVPEARTVLILPMKR